MLYHLALRMQTIRTRNTIAMRELEMGKVFVWSEWGRQFSTSLGPYLPGRASEFALPTPYLTDEERKLQRY